MYYFCRTRDPAEFDIYKKAHELDLTHFLEAGLSDPFMRTRIWNNQVWQLAHGYTHLDERTVDDFSESKLLYLAKEHLNNFSYVGFTETFDADAAAIISSLGLPKMKQIPKLNATPERLLAAEQPPVARELLDRLTGLDRQLYDYARNELPKSKRNGWCPW